jgi:hypothetical protein
MENKFIEGLYFLYLKSIEMDSSKRDFLIEEMYEEYIRELKEVTDD